jgi:hypothetical protein
MTDLETLRREYRRKAAEAREVGALAPLDRVYDQVAEDLGRVNGRAERGGWATTEQAAAVLPLQPDTISRKCAAGEFAGARKTGGSGGGMWMIPWESVYAYLGSPREREPAGVR